MTVYPSPEGTLVYVEAAQDDSFAIGRNLHGLRMAGFFDGAAAVLVGRTKAPGHEGYSQRDAAWDALAPLGVPVLVDIECGHVPPTLLLVNGALATVRHGEVDEIVQEFR
ncbi:MAG: hypothetical protein U0Q21_13965 [Dermatophilaceae bacterium]